MLREVALDIPEEAQAVDVVGELMPPALLTFDAESICVETDQSPGELPAWCEKALFFGDFSPVRAVLLEHYSSPLRERSKLKGDFRSLSENSEQKLIYISYWSQNVNTFCQIATLHLWKNLQFSLAKIAETAYTKTMRIYLGSDHRGFLLKEKVFAYLAKNGYDVEDVGGVELNPDDDFPQFAQAAALKVIGDDSKDPRAILICGGGQGMCMAANRFKGIRASVIWDAFEAKMTRNDNDSNILCLPARILEDDEAAWKGIIETWLNTPYANAPRFNRRNAQLDELS